jgi:hypothetical protein
MTKRINLEYLLIQYSNMGHMDEEVGNSEVRNSAARLE